MNIFEYDDYKQFVRDRIALMPKKGRGELLKIAGVLGIHTSRVSHILKGDLNFTLEQAAALGRYWGLSQLEVESFLLLVQLARAGTKDLKEVLNAQRESLRQRSQQLVNRLPRDRVLTENEKTIFYSSWFYSGIRLLTSIEKFNTIDSISEYLQLPREQVREVLDFLVLAGLCKEENGSFQMAVNRTHLESTSMLVHRHHTNWRLKALLRYGHLSERELAYTCPVSIAKKDQAVIRELLVQTIQKFQKTVTASEPNEMVAFLNLDWIEF